MTSCARTADAAYIGHWALVGPTVQKMLPQGVSLTDEAMTLPPLLALTAAAARVAGAAKASAIKRVVTDLPQLLSNSQKGMQGVIAKHLN